jgi:ribosomal protein L10
MSISAMCTARPTGGVAARASGKMSAAKFGCNTSAFAISRVGSKGRGSMVIVAAASKQKKSRDLNMLKGMLENDDTLLVAGFRYQGLSVSRAMRKPYTAGEFVFAFFFFSMDITGGSLGCFFFAVYHRDVGADARRRGRRRDGSRGAATGPRVGSPRVADAARGWRKIAGERRGARNRTAAFGATERTSSRWGSGAPIKGKKSISGGLAQQTHPPPPCAEHLPLGHTPPPPALPRVLPAAPQVKNMIKFRRDLPEGAHLLVTKNTLMVKASEGTKWEAISECATGMNAWIFVDENIAPAIKSVLDMQKGWAKDGIEVEFTGAVLDGKFIDAKGIGALEKLPTKKDLITMVAVGIKQVPTKLARATKGVPTKLAYGVKAIADGESDLISA